MSLASGFAYVNSTNHEKDDFLDGLSAADVHTILYDLFNNKSILQISAETISNHYTEIVILRTTNDFIINDIDYGFADVTCFYNLEKRLKGLFCSELKSENFYLGLNSDISFYIHILQKAGLIRQAGINWMFTKKARQSILDKSLLLKALIEGVGYGISWKCFDDIEANEIGQLAFGISIILLLKYGDKYRPFSFYSEKYLRFFELIKDIPHTAETEWYKDIHDIYAHRTFHCFARIFQFVDIDNSGPVPMVKPSKIFSSIFKFG